MEDRRYIQGDNQAKTDPHLTISSKSDKKYRNSSFTFDLSELLSYLCNMKIREVIAFKDHFENFLLIQPEKIQNKIFKIIEAIETLERIPSNYLKYITGTSGLYETRIQLGSNIWRVFCFFDNDKLVILLNGFQKKTKKTPKNEINKALSLMAEYHEQKDKEERE